MPFHNDFEKNLNDEMQAGPAPRPAQDFEMEDIKKARPSSTASFEDVEMHHKKDSPPRFSTLFRSAPAPAPAPQPAPRDYQQEYYPRAERRRGVFMPMPLLIVFAAILFLESTILFAYTVIGLYNNAPARLFPWAGQGGHVASAVVACDCGEKQSAVNFAPNFIMPQGAQAQVASEVVTVTMTPTPTTTSTTTSSTSTSTSATAAAAAASDIAGILGGIATTSADAGAVATSTQTPVRPTVTSVKFITTTPLPTVTATTFVNPPAASTTAADAAASPSTVTGTTSIGDAAASSTTAVSSPTTPASSSDDAAAWASVSSALAEAEAKLTPSPIPDTTTTPTPATTPTPVETSVSS